MGFLSVRSNATQASPRPLRSANASLLERIASGAQSRLPNAKVFGGLLLLSALSACTLAPKYVRPEAPVATQWPVATTQADASATSAIKWRDLFLDPRLQKTIELALSNNRDLRVAAANVTTARAQYGIARADLFPSLDSTVSGSRSHSSGATSTTGTGSTSQSYSANLGLSWELDLFGRIRSLSKAALEDFFAVQENRNAVTISLIGDTAQAWVDVAADQDAVRLAQQTLSLRKDSFDIATGQARLGSLSDIDLSTAKTEYEAARQSLAQAQTVLDQDRAALTLLAGAPVPDDLLPDGLKAGMVATSLPVGLPSQVLLNRPDVLASEHDLKAANADIGAARAALFPSISLTGSAGSASRALGDLFKSGNNTWSYGTSLGVPIFAGGANINSVRAAKSKRDAAVASYEGAIQSAFRDVSSALAVQSRIDERLDAQTQATDAAANAFRLSQASYKAGSLSYLNLIDTQRTLLTSQQTLITLTALKAGNIVSLYEAVGDDGSLQ